MAKPERNFINRIHRKLDPNNRLYRQAMGLTAMNGTPDYYYEGIDGAIWVEYKWYPEEPEVVDLYDTKKQVHLSKLQQNWLLRAHEDDVAVAVVAGYPKGCVVLFGDSWTEKNTTSKRFRIEDHKYTELDWAGILDGFNGSRNYCW